MRINEDFTNVKKDYLVRMEQGFHRYEKVRKLNVVQFKKLYDQSIITRIPFDQLVDEFTFD